MLSPRVDPVRGAIAWLERCPDPEADAALLSLMREPGLAQWRNTMRHALATKVKARHDRAFRHPPVSAIRAALTGGAPASAADLMAVVVEQLRQIQAEMQLDPLLPWQAYWNENPKGPKIENSCRNVVAQLLQARLRPFGILVPPMPEAQRAAETRADVLILNGAGASLPIEAKRHFHPEVWTAAGTQLR